MGVSKTGWNLHMASFGSPFKPMQREEMHTEVPSFWVENWKAKGKAGFRFRRQYPLWVHRKETRPGFPVVFVQGQSMIRACPAELACKCVQNFRLAILANANKGSLQTSTMGQRTTRVLLLKTTVEENANHFQGLRR